VIVKKLLVTALVMTFALTSVGAQQRPKASAALLTTPERTNFEKTSTYEDVVTFLDAVAKAYPSVHLGTYGRTTEGRAMPLVVIGASAATPDAVKATGKLRFHIQGNIHAGEVEGKESAQMLIRDLAQGKHADWLKSIVFIITPIYNSDGNERFALNNRGRQHGPIGGQGQRPNAQGLDLNRDFMKLESPEARAFTKLQNDYDPHVSMDLHTTDGTRHAYHLTYAPPLNPATDPDIIGVLRNDWLPAVTKNIKTKFGWDYYYYGDISGRSTTAGAPDERSWRTFDSRPRFHNNYIGLRNRFAILSEAFAYITFEDRIKATSRFIDEVLAFASANAARIKQTVEAADKKNLVGTKLSVRGDFARGPEMIEVLLSEVVEEKHPVDGHIMERRKDDVKKPERVADYSTFKSIEDERVPSAYYLPPTLIVPLERLAQHGIRMTALLTPETVQVEEFRITDNTTAGRFQGHAERTLKGSWVATERQLPAGTLKIDMTQPLARLAFYLLEPRSDDGLVDWNLMDDALGGDVKVFPIVRSKS
jgi:hypothetical protein